MNYMENDIKNDDQILIERAEEKRKSREKDQKDLEEGIISREELRIINELFAFPKHKTRILWDKIKQHI